jgi:hypothetical protein
VICQQQKPGTEPSIFIQNDLSTNLDKRVVNNSVATMVYQPQENMQQPSKTLARGQDGKLSSPQVCYTDQQLSNKD